MYRESQAAVHEIREEGIRWKTILEELGRNAQGVAEATTSAQAITFGAAMDAFVTRLEDMERRLEALGLAQTANPPLAALDPAPPATTNCKGILQERCILNECRTPVYTLVFTAGTPDSPVFRSTCHVIERRLTVIGEGRTVRASHQAAALEMLRTLNWPIEFPTAEERDEARLRREAAEEMQD